MKTIFRSSDLPSGSLRVSKSATRCSKFYSYDRGLVYIAHPLFRRPQLAQTYLWRNPDPWRNQTLLSLTEGNKATYSAAVAVRNALVRLCLLPLLSFLSWALGVTCAA